MTHLAKGYKLQSGKYRIEEKIGQGGFGITYRALMKTKVQERMGAMYTEVPVAIKEFFWKEYCSRKEGSTIVNIDAATEEKMFARFKENLKKEAEKLSKFDHPNIVRVLDTFEENNTAYMVMQMVEGESLKYKINREGKLDEATALQYTLQLCPALSEVHKNNILHLDVKPGNIIIDQNNQARLIDFGISKQYDDHGGLTSTWLNSASSGYAPPEQYDGHPNLSQATDVYALGATLYTMLTGQTPAKATQYSRKDIEPVHQFNPNVSKRTVSAISKAMEIKMEKRFQTIHEFCDAIINDDTIPLPPPLPPLPPPPTSPPQPSPSSPPSSKPIKYLLVAFCASAITGLAILLLYNLNKNPPIEPDIAMVLVKGGTFMMGCDTRKPNEKPPHRVTVDDFYIGKYPVTQAQWRAVMGADPVNLYNTGCDDCPVEGVSWNDIAGTSGRSVKINQIDYFENGFIYKLNAITGKTYRLPTEAEWEYAARGGLSKEDYPYSGSNNIGEVAWYSENFTESPHGSKGTTHPVGEKNPNKLGIYDMSGNVWEWCQDVKGDYSSSDQKNPKGPVPGPDAFRVLRGGSWYSHAEYCSVSYRNCSSPGFRNLIIGFRLVLPR